MDSPMMCSQAEELRLELGTQRQTLSNSNRRLLDTARRRHSYPSCGRGGGGSMLTGCCVENIPALNSIIRKIDTRKRRDVVILASVMSSSLFFFMWYVVG